MTLRCSPRLAVRESLITGGCGSLPPTYGQPLLWKSVKAALAVNAEGEGARFERVERGRYRIRNRVMRSLE